MRKNTINALYKNITSGTSTTLISKGGAISGDIYKITISNNNSSTATGICLYLNDGTNTYYYIRDVKIPSGATLVLDDNLGFNANGFNLVIAHDSGSGNPNLTVIIK